MLERQGRADEAMNEAVQFAGSWTHWAAEPAVLEKARVRLAKAIMNAQKPK